jgi:murein L,D-transpeptidase YafK
MKLITYIVAIICVNALIVAPVNLKAQPNFIESQKKFARVNDVIKRNEDTVKSSLRKRFGKSDFSQIFFRSFKFDMQFEVWIKPNPTDSFVLYKTIPVCYGSGVLGPKRFEGDYQIPEGFYTISHFNPNSEFHLSLGLNYPNASDRMVCDSLRPGGDIYIHGGCVSVGCLPIEDEAIEEVYLLSLMAKNAGQDFIPVHIFPGRFNNLISETYVNNYAIKDPNYLKFVNNLKQSFNYFETNRRLPFYVVNKKGEYIIK